MNSKLSFTKQSSVSQNRLFRVQTWPPHPLTEENAMMSHSHLDRYLSILLTTLELGYLKIQMYDFGYMT